MEIWRLRHTWNIEKWRHEDGAMEMETWRHQTGKRKPRRFSLVRLPFAPCANGSLSFVRFVDEETNGSYPIADGLNGLVHLCLQLQAVTGAEVYVQTVGILSYRQVQGSVYIGILMIYSTGAEICAYSFPQVP
jgi:hypothetical protein